MGSRLSYLFLKKFLERQTKVPVILLRNFDFRGVFFFCFGTALIALRKTQKFIIESYHLLFFLWCLIFPSQKNYFQWMGFEPASPSSYQPNIFQLNQRAHFVLNALEFGLFCVHFLKIPLQF